MAKNNVCCRADHQMIIDDCYNQVIARLTSTGRIKEISAHLLSVTTNHERVLYVHNIIKDLGLMPAVKANPKNNNVSTSYRNLGNKYFQQYKNFEALQYYNLSLLYAIPGTDNVSYAVSNRSAVLFALTKYEECLEDIKYVFKIQYPDKLKAKLLERQKKCNTLIKTREDNNNKNPNDTKIAELMKLKDPRDAKYVSSSSKLKVVHSKEMGRHVVANEDIKVGDVLIEENPYMTVLLKTQFLLSCEFCLTQSLNLYPCLTCTYTMYCSADCQEKAYKQYHKIECALMPTILAMDFTKIERLALRATLKSRTEHVSWSDTFDAVEKAESRLNTDLWGCIEVNNNWVYDSKYYDSIHTLSSNIEKRDISDIFLKCVTAAVFTEFLINLGFMKDETNLELCEKAKVYVSGTLLHHLMTTPTNMHGICTNVENAEGNFVQEYDIASGAYAFLSLINHSCAPNVTRCNKLGSGEILLIAIRPIKKGMQLFDNYGCHHALQGRAERQKHLMFQYKFKCECEACVNNWPTLLFLQNASLPLGIVRKKQTCLSDETIQQLMKGDRDTALKIFKPLCELLELLDPFAPCQQLAECQESLKQCFFILCGVLPHGYSKLIKWDVFPLCKPTEGLL